METYEALLKSQLKQLEEVLLRRHQAEFHALKQQYLLGVEKGAPGLSEDCGQNDEIPQERWCLERTRAVKRWESFSWKLLARQESSFDTEESIIAVRSSSERPDLRMRSSWCHSVMQKRVLLGWNENQHSAAGWEDAPELAQQLHGGYDPQELRSETTVAVLRRSDG
ncbi:unnamed protein product [Durusdinium trenchii]|uniref:Uncharacterized protein n=1 Tax=Durusdinium trenchii TaxID=1381693 RepID=A0ABP0JUG6_9DINO